MPLELLFQSGQNPSIYLGGRCRSCSCREPGSRRVSVDSSSGSDPTSIPTVLPPGGLQSGGLATVLAPPPTPPVMKWPALSAGRPPPIQVDQYPSCWELLPSVDFCRARPLTCGRGRIWRGEMVRLRARGDPWRGPSWQTTSSAGRSLTYSSSCWASHAPEVLEVVSEEAIVGQTLDKEWKLATALLKPITIKYCWFSITKQRRKDLYNMWWSPLLWGAFWVWKYCTNFNLYFFVKDL